MSARFKQSVLAVRGTLDEGDPFFTRVKICLAEAAFQAQCDPGAFRISRETFLIEAAAWYDRIAKAKAQALDRKP